MEELCVHLIVPFIEVSESRADPITGNDLARAVVSKSKAPKTFPVSLNFTDLECDTLM